MSQSRFEAWKEFHRDNPKLFELFVRFSREAQESGKDCFGAHAIGERIRWFTVIETKSADGLKLNDHHLPYYSRLAMAIYPDLKGFFKRRDARFDASDVAIVDYHLSLAA